MFIVRVQTGDPDAREVRTFTVESEKDMDIAADALKRTSCVGFSATVESAVDTRGRIKDKWDHSNRYFSRLDRTVQYGAYQDRISETYGLKEECAAAAEATNAEATCWASTKAIFKHVVGDLYKVTYISPFTD